MGLFFRRPRQVVSFRNSHPWLKLGIKRAINSGKHTDEQVAALQAALDDPDVLEAAFDSTDARMPVVPLVGGNEQRDWATFFAALGSFIEKLLPLIIQIISMFGGLGLTEAPHSNE